MLSLHTHNIINLYCAVDDIVPRIPKPKGGRPSFLSDSEITTILVWNTLTVKQKTIKDIYEWVCLYHKSDFPKMPKYNAFAEQCHRSLPLLSLVLSHLLCKEAPLRFVDSTMLQVCKLSRADRHKTAKNIAQFGKNWQGWHFGFKLHASVDPEGKLCGIAFTPANFHDAQALPKILNRHTKIAVGDTSYGASVMRGKLWKKYGTFILAYPHPKQKKKLMADWQQDLLHMRPKIETVFDYLKEHLHLVSSFPRSVGGYLFHYVRILLGYQVMKMGW